MTGKTDLDRRTVLRAITAASGAVLTSAILTKAASARSSKATPAAGPTDFEPIEVKSKKFLTA